MPVPRHRRRRIRASVVVVFALALLVAAPPLVSAQSAGVAPATPWRKLDGSTLIERIAFGSCLDQRKPQPIWTDVLAAAPQLFVLLGDNVYGNVKSLDDKSMPQLRDAYALQSAHPEFGRARAALPFLATWDDHDFGFNNAAGTFPLKVQSERLFREYWHLGPGPKDGGVYRAAVFGPLGRRVQVILLDVRYHRSEWERRAGFYIPGTGKYAESRNPGRTVLGATQWAWLEQQLRTPAEIRLIASSTQVLPTVHLNEKWGNFPHELERLLQLIGRTEAKGVVFLSGDRHFAAFYRRSDIKPYPLLEVTASALNRPTWARDGADPVRLTAPYDSANFGLARIDWAGRMVTFSIEGLGQGTVHRLDVPFKDLGH